MNYQHKNCSHCGQRLTYELDIDKGTVETLKTMARFIREKGINAVHLSKELLGNGLTNYQIGNISRLRFHGLVAKIRREAGNYCLTRKGIDFLEGLQVFKTAIIKKGGKFSPPYNMGYGDELVTINIFDRAWGEYWMLNGYEVLSGRVIKKPPVVKQARFFN